MSASVRSRPRGRRRKGEPHRRSSWRTGGHPTQRRRHPPRPPRSSSSSSSSSSSRGPVLGRAERRSMVTRRGQQLRRLAVGGKRGVARVLRSGGPSRAPVAARTSSIDAIIASSSIFGTPSEGSAASAMSASSLPASRRRPFLRKGWEAVLLSQNVGGWRRRASASNLARTIYNRDFLSIFLEIFWREARLHDESVGGPARTPAGPRCCSARRCSVPPRVPGAPASVCSHCRRGERVRRPRAPPRTVLDSPDLSDQSEQGRRRLQNRSPPRA